MEWWRKLVLVGHVSDAIEVLGLVVLVVLVLYYFLFR